MMAVNGVSTTTIGFSSVSPSKQKAGMHSRDSSKSSRKNGKNVNSRQKRYHYFQLFFLPNPSFIAVRLAASFEAFFIYKAAGSFAEAIFTTDVRKRHQTSFYSFILRFLQFAQVQVLCDARPFPSGAVR